VNRIKSFGRQNRYSGVICEDGDISIENKVKPLGMEDLHPSFEKLEKKEGKISKMYFEGRDETGETKAVGIIKMEDGIRIVGDETKTKTEMPYKVKYAKFLKYSLPNSSEGTITPDEVQNVVSSLREKAEKDNFVQRVCDELEIFNEIKLSRKEISEMEVQVSDICTPNLMVHFDTEIIIDMIKRQGAGRPIQEIIDTYCEIFKRNKDEVIKDNEEIEEKEKFFEQ